ncbi:MAG TPA: 3-phosphoglycerate dehydrogenase family protein [Planctomycetota bacterium]|jgi:D-3-phosphoglycerate dehydrogenase
MKILIADKVAEETVTALKALGDVRVDAGVKAEDLPASIGDADVLIVRSKKVIAKTIDSATRLSLIIRAGAGVDTIDMKAANARGIYVANCPGKNADAVAELAIGLLIAADRRIVDATDSLRNGKWKKGEFGKARGLKGRTLGLIGFGTIGRCVARRAIGLEMKVLAWSRSLTAEAAYAAGVCLAKSPEEVAQFSDAVSIHIAATPETKQLINEAFLSAMKSGAILINTSRGNVVDTAALKKALATGKLRAGLDVFEGEPGGSEAEFSDTALARSVVCTPHIGASTDQASEAIADEAVRIVKVFQQTGIPPNAVNICARSPAKYTLVVRHYDRVGVLASILDGLRRDEVNVEEMQNTVFEGAQAACCTLSLASEPSAETLKTIRENADVLQAELTTR